MRIVTDLIEADGIIDTREIISLESLRKKYDIRKEDEILASSYTLAMALGELSESDNGLKHDLLGDFMNIAMSDDFCARRGVAHSRHTQLPDDNHWQQSFGDVDKHLKPRLRGVANNICGK